MTRTEYLAALDRYLRRLPKADYQEAMEYFEEYFDEAGPENEAQVMAELGTPKEAANDIIHNILSAEVARNSKDSQGTSPSKRRRREILLIAVLGILSAPVSILILMLVLAMLVSAMLLVLTLILAGFAFSLSGLLVSGAVLVESFSFLASGSAFILTLGSGLVALGLSFLLLLTTVFLTKALGQGLVHLAKWLFRKVRRHA